MANTEIGLTIFFFYYILWLFYSLWIVLQSAKTRPGADYELIIAKLRLKLKKVGKNTRPFRYDLNQIPYDYTVAV